MGCDDSSAAYTQHLDNGPRNSPILDYWSTKSVVVAPLPCYRAIMLHRGRVLAVKWGMNPNSSSLGVDVTFLIFGAALVSMATPLLGSLLRFRNHRIDTTPAPVAATMPPTQPPQHVE